LFAYCADLGANDDQLSTTLFDFLVILFLVLGALASGIAVLPISRVFALPLVWYFVRVRNVFMTTSRELKRIGKLSQTVVPLTCQHLMLTISMFSFEQKVLPDYQSLPCSVNLSVV